jgi:hypothetical protein
MYETVTQRKINASALLIYFDYFSQEEDRSWSLIPLDYEHTVDYRKESKVKMIQYSSVEDP